MFCRECGRFKELKCVCLSSRPISKIETFTIFILFQFLTALVVFVSNDLFSYSFLESIPYISIVIFMYLLILSILTKLFDKSYLALFFGCHQAVNRSISINGQLTNICSRCLGILIGFALVYLLKDMSFSILFYIILGTPLTIDGLLQKFTQYKSNQALRLTTGILFSWTFSFLVTGYNYIILFTINLLL